MKYAYHYAAGTTVLIEARNKNYINLTLMQASDTDEQRYAPAESIKLFLTPDQMKELGEFLIKEAEEVRKA